MTIPTRRQIVAVMERHGLSPRKHLGQHFLADPNIIRRVVALSGVGVGSKVVEIGAGTGALTVGLAATGAEVVAFEIDERLRPVLEEVTADTGVDLRFADALTADMSRSLTGGPWTLVANLPYNVGTSIILDVLRHAPRVENLVVMVQIEVAERLAASPGSKVYGLPSVVAGIHAETRVAFVVPPQVFVPPPRVSSAVVVSTRVHPISDGAERAIELAAGAFQQRRKMLRRSLATILPDPAAVLTAAGIDPTARAEELSPADYLRLAGAG